MTEKEEICQPPPVNEKVLRDPREITAWAVSEGFSKYIQARVSRIPEFVGKHYSFIGALKMHSHAIGWDLIRVPLNIVWTVVNLFLALVAMLARLFRFERLSTAISTIPPGLETDMDRQIKWLVITELLELPYEHNGKKSEKDALMEAIFSVPALEGYLDDQLEGFDVGGTSNDVLGRLNKKLSEYSATRTGMADLGGNAVVLVASKLALGSPAYGTLSAGTAVSAVVANSIAVSNFWAGATLGSYYYAIFPVAASARLLIAVTAVIAIILAFVSTFIGIITDPIQRALGIHQKRLEKMIRSIEEDFDKKQYGDFQLWEKYMGRAFDIVDFVSFLGKSV